MDSVSCHKYMSKLYYANLSPQWIETDNDLTVGKVKNKEISLDISLSHRLCAGETQHDEWKVFKVLQLVLW